MTYRRKLKKSSAPFSMPVCPNLKRLCRAELTCGSGKISPKENMLMATMTKTQLVKLMAGKIELTNTQAATFLETLAAVAVDEAKKNGVFVVPGLRRLKKMQRKARMGRNPQTGEAIKIKAKTVAKFYVAKAVKDAIAPPKK